MTCARPPADSGGSGAVYGRLTMGSTATVDAGTRLAWSPAPLDALLSACLVGIAVLAAAVAAGRDEPGDVAPDTWWEWLVILVPSLAVAYRSRAPEQATPVAVIGQMAIWVLGLAEVFVAPLVMIYTVAAEGSRRSRDIGIASAVALSVMSAIGVVAAPDVEVDLLALTILSCAAVLLLGLNAARQREEAARLAAELATAQAERDAERERSVLGERQRIARELHDLVGHSLSVIAVRAEAAGRVAERRPDAVLAAVEAMGATARSSLVEVRSVLSGLREPSADTELRPAPSLDDLAELVHATAASSGRSIELRTSGATADVSHTTGAGVYRIVQEALTNVLKHAGPTATVVVDLEIDAAQLRLAITDDGVGPPTGGGDARGNGIAGLRARAEVLGGTLSAGPAPRRAPRAGRRPAPRAGARAC